MLIPKDVKLVLLSIAFSLGALLLLKFLFPAPMLALPTAHQINPEDPRFDEIIRNMSRIAGVAADATRATDKQG